jgi:hypothetical protein
METKTETEKQRKSKAKLKTAADDRRMTKKKIRHETPLNYNTLDNFE